MTSRLDTRYNTEPIYKNIAYVDSSQSMVYATAMIYEESSILGRGYSLWKSVGYIPKIIYYYYY